MPILRAIGGLFIYVASLVSLTCILVVIFQGIMLVMTGNWVWLWDYNNQPMLFVLLICIAIANWMIESECKDHMGGWG